MEQNTNINRVFDLLSLYGEKYSKGEVLSSKKEGIWQHYSSADFLRYVDEMSIGLLALGISKDDKVALMSPNRPEWNIVDFGIMQIGAVSVPLYPTLSVHDLAYILKDANIKVLFVADADLYEKIKTVQAQIPEVRVFSFDAVQNLPLWHEVKNLGKGTDPSVLNSIKEQVQPDDLLTLIYTSGTTGNPKGVMLTHNNLVSNFTSCHSLLPKTMKKALSFLPLSHIFERMVCYLYLYNGISIYYAESIEAIAANIKEVQPDVFTTVPRLLEKIYDKIVAKGHELSGVKKMLFFWALNLGLRYELNGANGAWYQLQLKLANKLIFSKWREALGGNVKAIISGGAALQLRLARVFNGAQIPVLQGYGLTETSPVIAVNHIEPDAHKLGSVGKAISGVEMTISDDGEVLCKGPNVMKGYYNRPDATAREIDEQGWFHTGDIGEIDADGFLFITGRKKEMFKTAGGKYVTPSLVENKIKESIFIEQIMVVGENQRFPAAVIVPSFAALKTWCEKHEINYTSNEEMVLHPEIIAKIKSEVDRHNAYFGHWEQVKKFVLLPNEWTIDGAELTPKLDIKRKSIMKKYASVIEGIFKQEDK